MRPDTLNPLFAETESLDGVGPRLKKPLDKLGLSRVRDLAYHMPDRFVQRRAVPDLEAAQVGEQIVVALTWAHRNRLTQADFPVGYTEASVTPEDGTTYNVRVFADDGTTLLREQDLGLVDNWTYDGTAQTEDGDPLAVWIELETKRNGLASHFLHRFKVVLNGGWGYAWGENWSGV